MSATLRSVTLLVIAFLLLVGTAILSYRSAVSVSEAATQALATQSLLQDARLLLIVITDAETGQRGYLLTGDPAYLTPYERAVNSSPDVLARLRAHVREQADQARVLGELSGLVDRKLAELRATVQARRDAGLEPALAIVRTGEGQALMDSIRAAVARVIEDAARRLSERQGEVTRATRQASHATIGALLLAVGATGLATVILVGGVRERARAESAQHLAAIVDNTDDAIVGMSLEGVITAWNAGAERIYGHRAGEAIGRPITLIIPPDRVAESEALLARLRRGELTHDVDTIRQTKDGRLIDVSVTISPIRGPGGRIVGASKIGRDITERKRAEAELKHVYETLEDRVVERTRQLEEINAELDAFAYTVSHDLRAPLRAMDGFASALVEDYGETLGAEGREYARRIVAAAQRMDRLIEDLLAYSRLTRAQIHTNPLPLADVVGEALQALEPEVRARSAAIDVVEPLGDALAHRETLRHAVVNLVGNAIKFVAPGVKPRVRIWSESRDGRRRLWVEDNGIGIDPQYHAGIFRVFHRLHGIETYPGTGIGLAIVRRGAERMGGRAGVESSPGAGARFWIELPAPGRA